MTVDIGIIIALREEFRELYPQLPSPQPFRDEETGVTDYLFQWGAQSTYQCAATFVGDMGAEKAALATERFIQRRQPNTVVMLGIAAGIDQDVQLGDVVVVTTANNYLYRAKAVEEENQTFTFQPSGDTYRCSDNLVRAVQELEFSEFYSQWQTDAAKRREAETELFSKLVAEGSLRNQPIYVPGAIASGPLVVSAESFITWLKQTNRNYLGVEMEGVGVLMAVASHADPKKTLILRGISDFGDQRKKELDAIGKGGVRRYAMNNAIALLWQLLALGIFPRNNQQKTPGNHQKTDTEESKSSEINQNDLLSILEKITPPEFERLIFTLGIPNHLMPGANQTRTERAVALLRWAQSPNGCGLKKIAQALK